MTASTTDSEEILARLVVALRAYRDRHAEMRAALGAAQYASARGRGELWAAASNKYPQVLEAARQVTELWQRLRAAQEGHQPDYSWPAIFREACEIAGWSLDPDDANGDAFRTDVLSLVSDGAARTSIGAWFDRGRRYAARADLLRAAEAVERARAVFENAVLETSDPEHDD